MLALRVSIFHDNVFVLHIPKLTQTPPKVIHTSSDCGADDAFRKPIRGTFFGCCAPAGAHWMSIAQNERSKARFFSDPKIKNLKRALSSVEVSKTCGEPDRTIENAFIGRFDLL
jgi:hypothetical protein